MEKFSLQNDIAVICVKAKSFPEGVLEAHEKLHALVGFSQQRRYFGISRPEGIEGIVYKAAAEMLASDEVAIPGCESFVIRKGKFISITVHDFTKDIRSIEMAFKELLHYPHVDPNGYCLEWYLNDKDVKCMVGITEE